MKRKKAPKIYPYKGNRLMWPISLYKEWYLYAKLADSNIGSFEEWFDAKKYAEPMQDDDVKIVSKKNNKLVLEFDLTHDLRRIGINFLKVITQYKSDYTYHSLAKVQPSKSEKNFTLQTSRQRSQVYFLKQQGVKNLEIAKKLKLISEEVYQYKLNKMDNDDHKNMQYLTAERTIQRSNAACKKILTNVKKGVFP